MTLDKRGSLHPWISDEVEYYDHQLEGVRQLAFMRSFLLADEMGLGKTAQALTVFAIDVFQGLASSAIVVCPATLKGNWMEEIQKFSTPEGFYAMELGAGIGKSGRRVSLGPAARRGQLKDFRAVKHPKILVVNYEQVSAHFEELGTMGFDVAIFDEAHYLKNPRAKRTKACMDLYTPRSFMLTGTPLLNRVDELWSILWRIDPTSYHSYWAFRQRYCVMGGWNGKDVIGVQNEAELTSRLQSVMVRRLKEDVLKLDKPNYVQRYVDLSPAQRKMYDEVANEMRLSIPSSPSPMEIENALTKFLRLKQICGTTATLIDKDDSEKLDLVIEDGAEFIERGEKVIVFSQFRGVLDAYVKRAQATYKAPVFELTGEVPIPQRQEIVRAWSDTKGPAVIACMLQVAGVGLNMVAASQLQFIDKLFVPGLNQQAVDRAHRIGQTRPVQVFEYIARDTIEKRIEDILKSKKKLSREIIEGGDDAGWKRMLVEEAMSS